MKEMDIVKVAEKPQEEEDKLVRMEEILENAQFPIEDEV